MRSFRKIVHNVLARPPFLFATPEGKGWADRLHYWTADGAEAVAAANVGELLSAAQETADDAGFKDLAESLATLHILWCMGFDDRARAALDSVAAPVREVRASLGEEEHQPKSPAAVSPSDREDLGEQAAIEVTYASSQCLNQRPTTNPERFSEEDRELLGYDGEWAGIEICQLSEGHAGPHVFPVQLSRGNCPARDLHGGACSLGWGHGGSHRSPSGLFSVIFLAAILLPAVAGAGDYRRPSWRDDDHDCQNTRSEVLVRTCRSVALSANHCKVLRATCLDLYSGAEISTDTPAQSLQVDHIFPAAEAWKRRSWTREAFADFFNDQRNLIAVRSRTNLWKSDKMPDRWCPADRGARLMVAKRFRRVARAYGLPIRPAEEVGLRAWERGECSPHAAILGGVR